MRTSVRTLAVSSALVIGASGVIAVNAVSAAGSGTTTVTTTRTAAAPKPGPLAAAGKIRNAMSAAPASVSRNATVVDYPTKPGGDFPVLRAGKNAWTCIPDDPGTPGNDPLCFDQQTAKWFAAWMAKKKPHLTSPGLAYMLRGSSDASNTDPFATKPAAGEHWMSSPPHVMVFPTEKLAKGTYSSDPANGGPWVMFPGTPYEHYMMPVAGGGHREMAGMGGMGGGGY